MQPLEFHNQQRLDPGIDWDKRATANMIRLEARDRGMLGPFTFTPAQHLAIIDGLFLGLSLQIIADKMRKPFAVVQERFFAMRRPVSITSNGRVNMPIDAQTALLNACKARVSARLN